MRDECEKGEGIEIKPDPEGSGVERSTETPNPSRKLNHATGGTRVTEQTQQYPEVYKVIGAPGTGKTTRVVGNPEIPDHTSLVQQNLEEYSLEEQMIVTYTKAGTEEAADRLARILNSTKSLISDRVVTIHAKCYRTLGLDREQVVRYWHKKQFCEMHDLEFGFDDDSADDIMAADKAAGNALLDIYGWLKSNRKPLSEWQDCPSDWTGAMNPEVLMESWEEYKDQNDLLDFSDMIENVVSWCRRVIDDEGLGVLFGGEDMSDTEIFQRARTNSRRDPAQLRGKGPFIDTKVLYVDEVQDLTPLQWDWYLAQKLVCEKVYIGGDDDQTIYGWAGANPNFMLDEEGDFEVLETTYRIPREVWETCDGVIRQVDKRQEKNVTPNGDGGEVVPLPRPSARQVVQHALEGSVFMLFRARYMIDEFRNDLHSLGIPYENMSTFDTWDTATLEVRDALAKMEAGEPLSSRDIRVLKENCSNKFIRDNSREAKDDDVIRGLGGTSVERVKDMFDFRRGRQVSSRWYLNYLENCKEDGDLNHFQCEAIKGNIRKDRTHLQPERVRIGTIHSSKGKEAETVILFLDSTATIMENMRGDTRDEPEKFISDAERRVYYVGMTRASERLVLVEGGVNPECTIMLRHLLGDNEDQIDWRQEAGMGLTEWD